MSGAGLSDARRAGFLYLLLAVVGPINQLYIPGRFIVPRDPAGTMAAIAAGEGIYRLGIVAGLASNILFLAVALALYQLLVDVDRRQARWMVALVVVGVAVGTVNLINQLAPLALLGGANHLSAFTRPQLDALGYGFLRLRSGGDSLAMAFWALWLLPFGTLVIRSRRFPRILGALLIVGCFAYLALSMTRLLVPIHAAAANRLLMPFYAAGEVSMILWLVFKGARPAPESNPAVA